MDKFKHRPIEVQAAQWWRAGDHPLVSIYDKIGPFANVFCSECEENYAVHGTLGEKRNLVCPGDWVVVEDGMDTKAMKPPEFRRLYEPMVESVRDTIKDFCGPQD